MTTLICHMGLLWSIITMINLKSEAHSRDKNVFSMSCMCICYLDNIVFFFDIHYSVVSVCLASESYLHSEEEYNLSHKTAFLRKISVKSIS